MARARGKSKKIVFLQRVVVMAGMSICLAGGTGLIGWSASPMAQEKLGEEAQEQISSWLSDITKDDGFVYNRMGSPDPFVPFLPVAEKIAQKEAEEELTGMRKFEPGQLTLVAIVFRGNEGLAMVQDPVGKGYIIRKGTKIGRVGVVESIMTNRVVINNVTYTRAGDKRINNVEMSLKKEGEKP